MFKRSLAALVLAAGALTARARGRPRRPTRRSCGHHRVEHHRRRRNPGFRRPHAAAHLRDDAHRDVRCGELHRRRLHAVSRARASLACASSEAAAAQAAHDVLVALLPAGTASFDAALATRLAKIHPRAHSSARRSAAKSPRRSSNGARPMAGRRRRPSRRPRCPACGNRLPRVRGGGFRAGR